MDNDKWYCPAIEKDIEHALCWEYCLAGIGGSTDTAYELDKWINKSNKFKDIEEFHRVCGNCSYCQWAKG